MWRNISLRKIGNLGTISKDVVIIYSLFSLISSLFKSAKVIFLVSSKPSAEPCPYRKYILVLEVDLKTGYKHHCQVRCSQGNLSELCPQLTYLNTLQRKSNSEELDKLNAVLAKQVKDAAANFKAVEGFRICQSVSIYWHPLRKSPVCKGSGDTAPLAMGQTCYKTYSRNGSWSTFLGYLKRCFHLLELTTIIFTWLKISCMFSTVTLILMNLTPPSLFVLLERKGKRSVLLLLAWILGITDNGKQRKLSPDIYCMVFQKQPLGFIIKM